MYVIVFKSSCLVFGNGFIISWIGILRKWDNNWWDWIIDFYIGKVKSMFMRLIN